MRFLLLTILLVTFTAYSNPILQMNKAFNALTELIPYLKNESAFKNKKNETTIAQNLKSLSDSFRTAGHDSIIKQDLFAPSYQLVMGNIDESLQSFQKGRKEYSLWLLKETVTSCMDCHSRLPESVTSSFQNGELSINQKDLKTPHDLGLTYMIVRRYVNAKEQFLRSFQDALIRKDQTAVMDPIKHIMAIELKIKKDLHAMKSLLSDLLKKDNLPGDFKTELQNYLKRLEHWGDEPALNSPPKNDRDIKAFIERKLRPLKKKNSFTDPFKVDLLLSSGIISHYFFQHQDSKLGPELGLWIGWIEKRLKKDEFMSSGDLFLKQCIRKYPRSITAKECLEEYKESVEFDFTGSAGTNLPSEIKNEIDELEQLIKKMNGVNQK